MAYRVPLPVGRSAPTTTAFTLIELLVVVSIIMLLTALILPALGSARAEGRATVCMSQLRQVGLATRMYISDFLGKYPYGVPKPVEVVNHPHYETWRPDGVTRGGGVPPQQQFFDQGYHRDQRAWVCPEDRSPHNYVWWDYTEHPDFTGVNNVSSYMFSEDGLFGFSYKHAQFLGNPRSLTASRVVEPASYGYAADGWECPNGWSWKRVDPYDPTHPPELPWHVRIDWSHSQRVNVLYADWHVERERQQEIKYRVRDEPANTVLPQ